MKVLKFGGTSVGNAESIASVVSVCIREVSQKKIIVLSANAGITDMLVEINNQLPYNRDEAETISDEISDKLCTIASDLDLFGEPFDKLEEMLDLINNLIKGVSKLDYLSPNVANRLLAIGEYISTSLFTDFYTNFQSGYLLDISNHLVYNSKTDTYELKDKGRIAQLLEEYGTIVTQGFICLDERGNISNLGRGGSDYTAAILAAEMDAEELQIWTDVNGILSADPRVIEKPVTKKSINVSNLSRMAFFGAKVIHPETLKPTLQKGIPVRILNTFDSKNEGTLVTNNKSNTIPTFTLKRNCYQYTFQSGKKKNLYYVNKYITNLIAKHNYNLLSSNQLENNLQYVFEKNIDLMMENDIQFTLKNIDLIYICELNNSKINTILKNVNRLKTEQMEIDWQNGAILILASTDNDIQSYNQFHDLLINSEE